MMEKETGERYNIVFPGNYLMRIMEKKKGHEFRALLYGLLDRAEAEEVKGRVITILSMLRNMSWSS